MTKSEIVRLQAQITPQIEKGDYVVLSKMLDLAQNTARMRYYRGKQEAVLAMKKIVESREQLITNHKRTNS